MVNIREVDPGLALGGTGRLGAAGSVLPIPAKQRTPVERTFRIEASRFEYSPAVLSVNPGDRVTIELVATDVVHGLSIDGYDLEIDGRSGPDGTADFRGGSSRVRFASAAR